jgi:hypothetical protein
MENRHKCPKEGSYKVVMPYFLVYIPELAGRQNFRNSSTTLRSID